MAKAAVVTGSAKRLGQAILLALAKHGYGVVVHYNKSRKAAFQTLKKAKKLGVKAIAVKADLTSEKQVKQMFRKIKLAFGKIDVLVNNVGNFAVKPLGKYSLDEWNYLLATTVSSSFVCCKHAIPLMGAGGRIINIGDSEAEKLSANPRITAYKIGKIGVGVLTKTLAVELAGNEITVNMVSPGIMFNTVALPPGKLKEVPMKRWARFEDITNAVLFLVKPESNYITGTNIFAGGGYKL